MKIASALPSSSGSSSRTNHTHMAEVRADGLEKYTDKLLGTGNQNNPSAASLEWARTSWLQPCCYATCLHLRTPKHGAFEMKCRLCFRWWRLSRLRTRPLDVEGRSRRSATSWFEMKGRCPSISNHPLEERKHRLSKATPSTTNGDMTPTRHQRASSPSTWGCRGVRLQRPPWRTIRQRRGPDGPRTTGPLRF